MIVGQAMRSKSPFRVGLCQRFELMDDGLYVGVPIAFR
jgi:hypothetical protein